MKYSMSVREAYILNLSLLQSLESYVVAEGQVGGKLVVGW